MIITFHIFTARDRGCGETPAQHSLRAEERGPARPLTGRGRLACVPSCAVRMHARVPREAPKVRRCHGSSCHRRTAAPSANSTQEGTVVTDDDERDIRGMFDQSVDDENDNEGDNFWSAARRQQDDAEADLIDALLHPRTPANSEISNTETTNNEEW